MQSTGKTVIYKLYLLIQSLDVSVGRPKCYLEHAHCCFTISILYNEQGNELHKKRVKIQQNLSIKFEKEKFNNILNKICIRNQMIQYNLE